MDMGPKLKNWARTVLLLGAALLAFSLWRVPAMGLDLAVSEGGLAFELKGGFITIAFDIGQVCPDSNSLRRLV